MKLNNWQRYDTEEKGWQSIFKSIVTSVKK